MNNVWPSPPSKTYRFLQVEADGGFAVGGILLEGSQLAACLDPLPIAHRGWVVCDPVFRDEATKRRINFEGEEVSRWSEFFEFA